MTLAQLIQQERLPADFTTTVDRYYRPLAERVAGWSQNQPIVLGINGGQGTGKSTMAAFLKELLEDEYGKRVAVLSIDDFYLTRSERGRLAAEVHPLLATRGVPGTHDPEMGLQVMDSLLEALPETQTPLPRFAKGMDDRLPFADWPLFQGKADVVIFEGWCVGATAQAADDLSSPVNQLEREEDAGRVWRRYVNAQLAGPYRDWFERIDRMIMLRAPSMACIRAWRGEQEDKLRAQLEAAGKPTGGVMNGTQLDRFIEHYQRLTEHQWRTLPTRVDGVVKLAEDHSIVDLDWKESVS